MQQETGFDARTTRYEYDLAGSPKAKTELGQSGQERAANRVVKHNDTLKVGFEYKEPGSQTVEIKHNQGIEVGNNQTLHIIKDQSVIIDGKHQEKVGTTSQVEAKQSIEFKVGGSSILIEPAKITIKSTMVAIEASALGSFKGMPLKLN